MLLLGSVRLEETGFAEAVLHVLVNLGSKDCLSLGVAIPWLSTCLGGAVGDRKGPRAWPCWEEALILPFGRVLGRLWCRIAWDVSFLGPQSGLAPGEASAACGLPGLRALVPAPEPRCLRWSHCSLRVTVFPAGIRLPNNRAEETANVGHYLVLSWPAGLVPVCSCGSVAGAPPVPAVRAVQAVRAASLLGRKAGVCLLPASLLLQGLALLPPSGA